MMAAMRELVIEGHDSAAKTPIAEGVKRELQSRGVRAEVYAPFRRVNAKIPEPDMYLYWAEDATARRAVELLASEIALVREEARERGVEVVIYDRHWMTVLSEIEHRPALRALWEDFLPTFFVEAPPVKTMSAERFSFGVPWTSSAEKVAYYYQVYLALAERYARHIVARFRIEMHNEPREPIIGSIAAHASGA
jgi:hypothetical protein